MNRLLLFASGALLVVVALLSVAVLQSRSFSTKQEKTVGASATLEDEGAPTGNDPRIKRDTLLSARSAPAAPAFAEGAWINSDALSVEKLRGRVVLVDFWTFGCYNCRNTLPALKKFNADYGNRGLTIVGVHSPEFEREKNVEELRRQTQSLGILYPVVSDNDFDTWRAYGIEAWPTVVILDKKGRIRYSHVGEGSYEAQGRAIETLLAE